MIPVVGGPSFVSPFPRAINSILQEYNTTADIPLETSHRHRDAPINSMADISMDHRGSSTLPPSNQI